MTTIIAKRPFEQGSEDMLGSDSKRLQVPVNPDYMENVDTTETEPDQSLDALKGSESRVILLKGINDLTTDEDVQAVVGPFNQGELTKTFLRNSSGHAFIEFLDAKNAGSFLKYMKDNEVLVKGSRVQAMFSKRDHVTAKPPQPQLEASRICLVTVHHLVYPVYLETLHAMLSRCGTVEKIVCFSRKPDIYQALVQFRDTNDAKTAISMLHNRSMYQGCNTVQILPSRLTEVNVRENDNTRSWDFTVQPSLTPLCNSSPMLQSGTVVPGNSFPMTQQALSGMRLTNDFNTGQIVAASQPKTQQAQSAVVIVYNVPHEGVNVTKLFNLFSLYGNVSRIKIIRDKPDTALVQYSNPGFAVMARQYLHESPLYDSMIQVVASKNWDIKMPMRSSDDIEPRKTMEFGQREQRYKVEETEKYKKSACKPTSTLFIANIAEDVEEEELTQLIASEAEKVRSVEIRPSKAGSTKKTAIIGVPSPKEAVKCVCNLHNHELHGCSLKLAFSKMNVA